MVDMLRFCKRAGANQTCNSESLAEVTTYRSHGRCTSKHMLRQGDSFMRFLICFVVAVTPHGSFRPKAGVKTLFSAKWGS